MLNFIDEFAVHMDHAGPFVSLLRCEQAVEAGKAIGLDRADIACKMVREVLPRAVAMEAHLWCD